MMPRTVREALELAALDAELDALLEEAQRTPVPDADTLAALTGCTHSVVRGDPTGDYTYDDWAGLGSTEE